MGLDVIFAEASSASGTATSAAEEGLFGRGIAVTGVSLVAAGGACDAEEDGREEEAGEGGPHEAECVAADAGFAAV